MIAVVAHIQRRYVMHTHQCRVQRAKTKTKTRREQSLYQLAHAKKHKKQVKKACTLPKKQQPTRAVALLNCTREYTQKNTSKKNAHYQRSNNRREQSQYQLALAKRRNGTIEFVEVIFFVADDGDGVVCEREHAISGGVGGGDNIGVKPV
jgi:hypothetical protein